VARAQAGPPLTGSLGWDPPPEPPGAVPVAVPRQAPNTTELMHDGPGTD